MHQADYRRLLSLDIKEAQKVKNLRKMVEQQYLDEEGHAVIDIQLYQGLDFFDPLSMGKQREMNPEIIDFIDRKSNLIPGTTRIVLHFHGGNLSKEEQTEAVRCLQEHYSVALQDKAWDLRSNNLQLLVLSVIGMILLSLYLFFALQLEDGLFLEVLSIIGSFALWEAADRFLIERSVIRKDMIAIAQNKNQLIRFDE